MSSSKFSLNDHEAVYAEIERRSQTKAERVRAASITLKREMTTSLDGNVIVNEPNLEAAKLAKLVRRACVGRVVGLGPNYFTFSIHLLITSLFADQCSRRHNGRRTRVRHSTEHDRQTIV